MARQKLQYQDYLPFKMLQSNSVRIFSSLSQPLPNTARKVSFYQSGRILINFAATSKVIKTRCINFSTFTEPCRSPPSECWTVQSHTHGPDSSLGFYALRSKCFPSDEWSGLVGVRGEVSEEQRGKDMWYFFAQFEHVFLKEKKLRINICLKLLLNEKLNADLCKFCPDFITAFSKIKIVSPWIV